MVGGDGRGCANLVMAAAGESTVESFIDQFKQSLFDRKARQDSLEPFFSSTQSQENEVASSDHQRH